ncbi:MAG: hypothetical protein HFG80_09375 [Eubacterium sp.]|nr:hypothetical protein [Eubacterium sp.]
MVFVKTQDLREGMRLAKPIFNKNGTLLYDRESRLTKTAIPGIANFGLPGLFILEPAEPAPPITEDEIEYERMQTIFVFQIREDFSLIEQEKQPKHLHKIVETIMQSYGKLDKRITFVQNLRSSEDFTYKHGFNTAILCCMLCHELSVDSAHQLALCYAGLIHDIGMVGKPGANNKRAEKAESEKKPNKYSPGEPNFKFFEQYNQRLNSYYILNPEGVEPFGFPQTALAIVRQFAQALYHPDLLENEKQAAAWTFDSKILHVANTFDMMTAMREDSEPMSYLSAIRYMKKNPQYYDSVVVNALCRCLNILPSGACVDLSNGGKGLVLEENPANFECPVILQFDSMKIIDLRDRKVARQIQIVDNMRTMDNRIKMDQETLNHFTADEKLVGQTARVNQKLKAANQREQAAKRK